MIKIYRRYNSVQSNMTHNQSNQNKQPSKPIPMPPAKNTSQQQTPPSKKPSTPQPINKSIQSPSNQREPLNNSKHAKPTDCEQKKSPPKKRSFNPSSILQGVIPSSIYNPKTKKILGLLSSEDLLLIALIFLFMENDESDNSLVILALIYVLLSDRIDLSDFNF